MQTADGMPYTSNHPTRRHFLRAGSAAGSAMVLCAFAGPARATPEAMQAEIRRITGGANIETARVRIDIPLLVENGNTVPMTVTVDSPMTDREFVRAIHVLNEKNPQPQVVSAHLGPRAGKAAFSTRIRLADSQTIVAIAETSDGRFWRGEIDVIVTIAACLEEL